MVINYLKLIFGNFHFNSRSNECDGGKGEKSLQASCYLHFWETHLVTTLGACLCAGALNQLTFFAWQALFWCFSHYIQRFSFSFKIESVTLTLFPGLCQSWKKISHKILSFRFITESMKCSSKSTRYEKTMHISFLCSFAFTLFEKCAFIWSTFYLMPQQIPCRTEVVSGLKNIS